MGAAFSILTRLVSGLFVLAMAGFFVWVSAPGLIHDWPIVMNPEPAAGARFLGGSCRSQLILTLCGTEVATASGAVLQQGMFWLDMPGKDYTVELVQAAGDPERVATTPAIDHYWNRAISNAVIIALLLAGAFANFFGKAKPKEEAA